jgi:hypothetical protein
MGLDYNSIKILLWAKNLGVSFERSLTLGHQGLDCSPRRFRRVLWDFGLRATEEEIVRCLHHDPCASVYADEFLRFLGAKELASVDRSHFEGATLLHDLNDRFPEQQRGRFTLVFDGGTLEHVFDYPAALRHCLELVALGGYFITSAPAQNFMGHGFYQISPELFFRVFSRENGFALRKIVLYDSSRIDASFFQVHDPALTGLRSQLNSSQPMLLTALAQRIEIKPILACAPQQSDYAAAWERHGASTGASSRSPGRIERLRTALNPYWPYWLRHLRRRLAHSRGRGAPTLRNRRHFRRISRQEIFRERAEKQTT